jgi:thiol-disulfide isomerase/thioredoxin
MMRKNKMKIFIAVLMVSVAAFITVMATKRSPKPDNALTVKTPDAQLVDASNKALDFSAFKGKVVFVNNWASWCPPCIAEMPSIQALKSKLKGADVVFVMVSFDEDPKKAKAFIEKRSFDFDIYFPGDHYPYPTSSIPATFILDKSGTVISEHAGMADYSSDELAEQLKALANE